jgi:hypothetical protein
LVPDQKLPEIGGNNGDEPHPFEQDLQEPSFNHEEREGHEVLTKHLFVAFVIFAVKSPVRKQTNIQWCYSLLSTLIDFDWLLPAQSSEVHKPPLFVF